MFRHSLALLLALPLAAGCAARGTRIYQAYDGAEQPAAQIATLRVGQKEDITVDTVMSYRGLGVVEIDGRSAGGNSFFMNYPNEVHLQPGRHTVKFVYVHNTVHGGSHAFGTAAFEAVPGHNYTGKYRDGFTFVEIWIEDDQTGRRVDVPLRDAQ